MVFRKAYNSLVWASSKDRQVHDKIKQGFEEHAGRLIQVAKRYVVEEKISQDIVTDVFLRWAFAEKEGLNIEKNLFFLLKEYTIDLCVTNGNAKSDTQNNTMGPVCTVTAESSGEEMFNALITLPALKRNAYNLVILDGYAPSVAAERLGVSEQEIEKLVRNARMTLQGK